MIKNRARLTYLKTYNTGGIALWLSNLNQQKVATQHN